jgi:hypothetical protein
MLTLTLTAALFSLLPEHERVNAGPGREVSVDASNWSETVAQIQARFPRLAARVLDGSGAVKPGFLIAVNNQVPSSNAELPDVTKGDEVFLFAQIAGG